MAGKQQPQQPPQPVVAVISGLPSSGSKQPEPERNGAVWRQVSNHNL